MAHSRIIGFPPLMLLLVDAFPFVQRQYENYSTQSESICESATNKIAILLFCDFYSWRKCYTCNADIFVKCVMLGAIAYTSSLHGCFTQTVIPFLFALHVVCRQSQCLTSKSIRLPTVSTS